MSEPARIRIGLPTLALSALDYGRPHDDAPAVVLLHGMADLAWSLDPLAQGLADRYHVVSLDLRGHGESDHTGGYSILHHVADLDGVLGSLGLDRPILVGHSLGGQVTSHFAGLFPEKVGALVVAEGLGPPVRLAADRPEQRLAMARARVGQLGAPARHRPLADLAAATERLLHTHPGLDPARARFLAERGTTPGPDGGLVWKFDPRTRDWLALSDWTVTEERWRAVRCPVLTITGAIAWERWWKQLSGPAQSEGWGDHDPAEVTRRAAQFPDVEHVELADAGHMLAFDAPDALGAGVVRDFLARRVPH